MRAPMADEDFDIEKLAAYLHLDLNQVTKLADRGKLPGRRVAGVWRFSPAEIHHWLEERIGLSDSHELARVEEALDRDREATAEPPVTIAEILPLAAIDTSLPARTRNSVITSMVELAATDRLAVGSGENERSRAAAARICFPRRSRTGWRLLHPRGPLATILERPFLALGLTDRGIPFASRRGLVTDIFFLICSTDDRGHLRTLARLSRLLAEQSFRAESRGCANPAAARI